MTNPFLGIFSTIPLFHSFCQRINHLAQTRISHCEMIQCLFSTISLQFHLWLQTFHSSGSFCLCYFCREDVVYYSGFFSSIFAIIAVKLETEIGLHAFTIRSKCSFRFFLQLSSILKVFIPLSFSIDCVLLVSSCYFATPCSLVRCLPGSPFLSKILSIFVCILSSLFCCY